MASHAKKEDPKNKPSIHIPVAALKRFANDLESEVATSKFLQINRDRVSEFIDKKPHKPVGESSGAKTAASRTFHVPGINDYSDLSSPPKKPMIQLQNRPEFDHALGSRSRFGEGDGSFFDKWLNADIAKTKHLVDKDGFPVLKFKGQIDTGFKRHMQEFNDGLDEPKQPVYVQTYAQRKAERLKRYWNALSPCLSHL